MHSFKTGREDLKRFRGKGILGVLLPILLLALPAASAAQGEGAATGKVVTLAAGHPLHENPATSVEKPGLSVDKISALFTTAFPPHLPPHAHRRGGV